MSKNVSNQFKEVIQNGGPFYSYAEVTFTDGTNITLDSENDFFSDGNNYSESGGDGFPLGVSMSKTIDIGIDNSDERFSQYDFYYARITFYTEADLADGTKERLKEGTFTVIDPVANGDLIEFSAYDDMYKADVVYVPGISFPSSAISVLQDACGQCDINLGSATFTNSDFQISSVPEGLTCRQVIGYIAMIAVGNAIMDENNRLIIKSYDFSVFERIPILSGGVIGDNLKDSVSGGTFGDALADYISAGEFGEMSDFHILADFPSDPDISTDDVVITGIRMEVEGEEEDETIVFGTEDYALTVENELVSGKENELVTILGNALVGVIVRPFSGEFFPNPTLQFMDCVYLIDRKDNIYQSFITDNVFNYLGNSDISNNLESPLRNNSTYYSNATEAYRKARAESKKQKSEWEKAMEELSERVNNSSGLYMTEEKQSDGSYIYYMHDNPTLEESMIIWKMTAEAFSVSADGGKTYTAGLTVDGTLITKIMNTIGINFDWGIGGTLIIRDKDGKETVYMDAETGTVRMNVESLTISGRTPEEIADDKVNDFVSSVYDPAIKNLQYQIDGQIESWYYDYEPTLSNAPASSWTTEEERAKHEGDLFYWKSKGYSYRFFKDGSTWKWQMVQDTDITKALAAASEAQDTADNKRRVFVTTPVPPYDIGDLWTQGTSGDIMRCQVARQSGNYVSSDWGKASKYTDDSAVNELDNSLDQEGVFNRLTNNGALKGLYMDGNNLYINADFIKTGILKGQTIKGSSFIGGSISITYEDEDGYDQISFVANRNGVGIGLAGEFLTYRSGNNYITLDGEMRINSGRIKGYKNGYTGFILNQTQLDLYSWNDLGKYVGTIGSVKNESTGRSSIEMWCSKDGMLLLGYDDGSGTTGNIKRIFSFDAKTPNESPFIANTASGTLFSNNADGITVKNGLITGWNMNLSTGDIVFYSSSGNKVNIHVKSGLITGWDIG